MKRLVYRPEAAADVRAAFEWYEGQREGLGEQFLAELTRAERTVQENPTAFRILRRDARRIMLRRFSIPAVLSSRDGCRGGGRLLPRTTVTEAVGEAKVMANWALQRLNVLRRSARAAARPLNATVVGRM